MAPVGCFFPSVSTAASACVGRSCAITPGAVVTAIAQLVADPHLDAKVDAAADSHGHGEVFDHADLHSAELDTSHAGFGGTSSVGPTSRTQAASNLEAAEHPTPTVGDFLLSGPASGSRATSSGSGVASFLNAPEEMSPLQLKQRKTQLRVAMGISAATMMTAAGLVARMVYRIARRKLDAKTDENEEEKSLSATPAALGYARRNSNTPVDIPRAIPRPELQKMVDQINTCEFDQINTCEVPEYVVPVPAVYY